MGYEAIQKTRHVTLNNIWAGWFPGKEFNEIPGSFADTTQPIGGPDVDNCIWLQGALRKMFGYTVISSSAINSGARVTSLFYSGILGEFVGTVGNAIYSDMDQASPTAITGGLTVTANLNVSWDEWQYGSTKYVIGTNGTNAPWKWTGSGNAAALGGTPPNGKYVKVFQNAVWFANVTNDETKVSFSNIVDPETYTNTDNYVFDAPITGLGVLGNFLVVFMEDHIGILSGSNNRQLIKVDRFINGIGTTAHQSIRNCKIQGRDVLTFTGKDGIFAFDGSKELTKLSNSIEYKFSGGLGARKVTTWNTTRYSSISATYSPVYNWYILSISDSSDSMNNFLVFVDLERPFIHEGNKTIFPCWPVDSVNASIIYDPGTGSNSGTIYFGSDDGYVYSFDNTVFNQNESPYEAKFTSKYIDNTETVLIQEANILGELETSTNTVQLFIATDLDDGTGNQGDTNFESVGDQLDVDFIMESSELSGYGWDFPNAPTFNFGRFIKFTVKNVNKDEKMSVIGIDFILQGDGLQPNRGN